MICESTAAKLLLKRRKRRRGRRRRRRRRRRRIGRGNRGVRRKMIKGGR
jgi:hypothetical protein